jgi:multicomponent Na+:H+ antiporter subunit E
MHTPEQDSAAEHVAAARRAIRALPREFTQTTLTCPLCGAKATARGLRRRPSRRQPPATWQLVFTCPGCGLITYFDAPRAAVGPISQLPGSAWTREMRQYRWVEHYSLLPQERAARPEHFLAAFIICMLSWLLLTGSLSPVDVIWGVAMSALAARISFRLAAFGLPRWLREPRRWGPALRLLLEFNRQLIVQNVTLAWRVLQPRLTIRPGIVAVPTRLRDDVSLTVLGSLMTLTPDTVTLEIDQNRGLIYVHWIDVQTTEPQKARQLISEALENQIRAWLH